MPGGGSVFLRWRPRRCSTGIRAQPCAPARAFETKRLLNNVSRGARPWNCILSFSASARKIARLFFFLFFSFTSNPVVTFRQRRVTFSHFSRPLSFAFLLVFLDVHSYRRRGTGIHNASCNLNSGTRRSGVEKRG